MKKLIITLLFITSAVFAADPITTKFKIGKFVEGGAVGQIATPEGTELAYLHPLTADVGLSVNTVVHVQVEKSGSTWTYGGGTGIGQNKITAKKYKVLKVAK